MMNLNTTLDSHRTNSSSNADETLPAIGKEQSHRHWSPSTIAATRLSPIIGKGSFPSADHNCLNPHISLYIAREQADLPSPYLPSCDLKMLIRCSPDSSGLKSTASTRKLQSSPLVAERIEYIALREEEMKKICGDDVAGFSKKVIAAPVGLSTSHSAVLRQPRQSFRGMLKPLQHNSRHVSHVTDKADDTQVDI